MKTKRYIGLLFMMVCLFMGCERQAEPDQQIALTMNLCLPIENNGMIAPRRIMGDPGTAERFALPRYLYIFVLKKYNETWQIWKKEERVLNPSAWVQTYYTGYRMNFKDSVYRYDQQILYLLNNDKPEGKIYAICSNKRLMSIASSMASITTADAVLNLTFNTAPDSIQENLQNIYSTPYNYEVNDEYYCSYDCSEGNGAYVDLILYHVAAKVDITWNVAEEKRINKEHPENAVRLTSMQACKLFNGNAACFKPMKNSSGASVLGTGETVTLVKPEDEGLWWEGRSYFYTIPYTTTAEGYRSYFPLQMKMATNDSTKYYEPTIYLKVDTVNAFVPWLRANFKLSNPLTEGTDTKKVDNTVPQEEED